MPPRKYDQYPYPVEDIDAAKRWLWTFGRVHEWIDGDADAMPLHARLVCDVFWVKPETLLRDLRKDWQRALAAPRPSWRGRSRSWGRA